jgi:hypothetical protein
MSTSFPELHPLLNTISSQNSNLQSQDSYMECRKVDFKKCMANPNATIEHCRNICRHKNKQNNWGFPRCDVDKNSLAWYKSAYDNCVSGSVGENCCKEITCSNPSVVNKKC